MDTVRTEIDEYVVDEDVKEIDKSLKFEDYWKEVGNLTDGGWKRFNILPSFAVALSVLFSSNSEVERHFSLMNNIHQNKQRNCLSQETLNAILHIRSGVESSLVRKNCGKCEMPSAEPHCHCSLVDITGDIREHCKQAHSKYVSSQAEARADKENETEEFKKKHEEFIEKEEKRIGRFKETLSRKPAFYKDELFQPVFKDRRDPKRKAPEPSQSNPAKKSSNVTNNNNKTTSKNAKR